MDKFINEKFIDYSTLDKIKILLELFNDLKSQFTSENKTGIFKKNVVIDKIIKILEETLKDIELI